jgi:hypothetical protein
VSGVSRPNTYHALANLIDLGLIIKLVSSPARYKPLSIYEAFSLLIKKREKDNIALYKKAAVFHDLFTSIVPEPNKSEICNQFMLVPDGLPMISKLNKRPKPLKRWTFICH